MSNTKTTQISLMDRRKVTIEKKTRNNVGSVSSRSKQWNQTDAKKFSTNQVKSSINYGPKRPSAAPTKQKIFKTVNIDLD